METVVKELEQAAGALKTLYKRRADALGLLKTKPAWEDYCLISADLVKARAESKRAEAALEQRATEMFQATFNVNPAPGVSVVQTPVIEYDSEEDVIAWLCKHDMQDLLIPDWDAIKRRALAARDIDCVSVVMAPKVMVSP